MHAYLHILKVKNFFRLNFNGLHTNLALETFSSLIFWPWEFEKCQLSCLGAISEVHGSKLRGARAVDPENFPHGR